MDIWAGAPVPGDLRFEDDGERLDRERFSDPGPGPFLTQSSWEQFKDEVGECESRAAVTRVVPSAAQLKVELEAYFAKMDVALASSLISHTCAPARSAGTIYT